MRIKQSLFCGVILVLGLALSAEPFATQHVGLYKLERGARFVNIDDDAFYLVKYEWNWHGDPWPFGKKSYRSQARYDEYGFPNYSLFDSDFCVLGGGGRFLYMDNNADYSSYTKVTSDIIGKLSYGEFLDKDWMLLTSVFSKEKVRGMLNYGAFKRASNGVELYCSSNLVLSGVTYDIKNIQKCFVEQAYNGSSFFWDSTLIPWAEAESGPGIGVQIEVKFVPNEYSRQDCVEKGMCNSFVIMNGYVDLFRRDLFKKNNRVRKILVQSADGLENFSFEYELKDTPDFQEISLPRYASRILITIESVYPGTLYDDTCLSGIFTPGYDLCYGKDKSSEQEILNNAWAGYMNDWSEKKKIQTMPEGY